jgi:hypothetical protein
MTFLFFTSTQPFIQRIVFGLQFKYEEMKIYFSLITVIIFLCISCSEDPYIEDNNRIVGTGPVITGNIVTAPFTSLDLEGVANVYIETGREQSITFTAYKNILAHMEGRVAGDRLIVRFTDDVRVSSDKEIRVDITIPEMNKVTLSGVGNFYLKGPTQESLDLELNGVGNIDAFNLPVYIGIVEMNGTGNVKIRAKDRLEVDIDGLGNVYYQGSPELHIDISGLGEVVSD